MSVVGRTLYCLEGILEVQNYPLKIRSSSECRTIARIKMTRRIESAEAAALSVWLDTNTDRFEDSIGDGLGISLPYCNPLHLFSVIRYINVVIFLYPIVYL